MHVQLRGRIGRIWRTIRVDVGSRSEQAVHEQLRGCIAHGAHILGDDGGVGVNM